MEISAGDGAGTGSGFGAGGGFGAAFEREGGNGEPNETAALVACRGTIGTWQGATAGSEAPVADKESFKVNWLSMLRPWGATQAGGKIPEDTAGDSVETDAANENSGGHCAGRNGAALAFGGREAQSTLTASGRAGSTVSASVAANSPTRVNQPLANKTRVADGHQSAFEWSATKTTSSTGSSFGDSKIERRNSLAQNAGVRGRATHGSNGVAGSPVDGDAAAAAPIEANIPLASEIHSVAPSEADVRSEDQMAGPAAITNQPATVTTAAVVAANDAHSKVSVPALTNSGANARAAGQIPIHGAQASPTGQTMNSAVAAETRSDDQEESAAIPQASLAEMGIATSSVPRAVSVTDMGPKAGVEEHKNTAGENGGGRLTAHRRVGEGNGTTPAPAAAAPAADKSGMEAGNSETLPAKMANDPAVGGPSAAASHQNGPRVVVAQPSGMETSAIVRDPSGTHGILASAAEAGSTSAGAPAAGQETFAALDAGTTVGSPNWIHAGGRQAEAGFNDPALGWVGVRAELSGVSIHAAIVPGSTEAAQALSGHLAGLSAYLSENHTPVATLTMSSPGNSGIGAESDQSLAQGLGRGMQQSAGQDGKENQTHAFELGSQPSAREGDSFSSTSSAVPASGLDAPVCAGDGLGAHISVMA